MPISATKQVHSNRPFPNTLLFAYFFTILQTATPFTYKVLHKVLPSYLQSSSTPIWINFTQILHNKWIHTLHETQGNTLETEVDTKMIYERF